MAELKTKPNDGDVEAFLNGSADEGRRGDCYTVLALMREVTGAEPKMWGASIVGFGSQHYLARVLAATGPRDSAFCCAAAKQQRSRK